MNILIANEGHFYRTSDGKIWTEEVSDYYFWSRYTKVFKEITVVARVKNVDEPKGKWKVANGKDVKFLSLPDYLGPKDFMKKRKEINQIIKRNIKKYDGYILRVPGQVANCIWKYRRKNIPLFLEVVGDPWDSMSKGTIDSKIRPLARIYATLNLKWQCINADGVAFVTESTLQKRYKIRKSTITTNYSSIELLPELILEHPKKYDNTIKSFTIVNVGSMNNNYKGQDTILKAAKIIRDKGYNIHLKFIGNGYLKEKFMDYSKNLGVDDITIFTGKITNYNELLKELDNSDIFILSSLAEGLPRAMIEAMSRGLPCIGTKVGGIPELLSEEDLVDKKSPEQIANKVISLVNNPHKMYEKSMSSIQISHKYRTNFLEVKRNDFYNNLKNSIEDVEII